MKKNLLFIILLFCATTLFAQWVPVNNGLPDYPPTALCSFIDTMYVSTYGGGIYGTYDNGENWNDCNGDLPNLFVNDIRASNNDIYVSTNSAPYLTPNVVMYFDCSGTGLTNTDVNFFSRCGEDLPLVGDYIVGTNGGGIFAAEYTSPLIFDWATANPGISGAGLIINDGVIGEAFAFIATDGGMYQAEGSETEWTAVSDGLSGDALKVNKICYLGLFLIATDGGLYYSANMEDGWTPVIPDEKLNIVLYMNTDISPSGFMIFALGENGFYTEDLQIWTQLDFGGIEGEVTAAHADTTNLYIGFTTTEKSGKGNGGMYRKPLEQFLVGIEDENLSGLSSFNLGQNYPNPFSQSTKISYSLKKSDFITLKVYNFAGREIKTLINNFQEKGDYSVVFDAENLANGIYSYKLQIGNNLYKTKKMMLVK